MNWERGGKIEIEEDCGREIMIENIDCNTRNFEKDKN